MSTVTAAVVLRAGDAPATVLAGDEAALAVARVAVGEGGGLAEVADRSRLLLPLQDAVVREVAAQQVAAVAEPDRPLGPAEPRREALHRREREAVAPEARVKRVDGGVRICLGGLPHAGSRPRVVGYGFWDGCSSSFCTRQFSSSATYKVFSEGQAIS